LKITADKLERDLAAQLRSTYLLCGDEPLLVSEAADRIRAAARAQGFTEREVFFVERATGAPWNDMLSAAQSLSLFASRRILEIRLPTGKPGTGAKTLQQLVAAAGPDLLLLVIAGELDRDAQGAAWVLDADRAGAWVTAQRPSAAAFPAWLRSRAAAAGLRLTDEGVDALVARTEGNLLAAHQEIEKLALAGLAEAGATEVLASSTASSRFDVTDLGGAILAGDAARALRILASLRGDGTEPTLVLWAILQELRSVWSQLVPGARITGVWSRHSALLPDAAARLRARGRGTFAALAARAGRVDRQIKGQLEGECWDEIAMLIADFAGKDTLALPRRRA
jgi:DNA polymerase III subunit delta